MKLKELAIKCDQGRGVKNCRGGSNNYNFSDILWSFGAGVEDSDYRDNYSGVRFVKKS